MAVSGMSRVARPLALLFAISALIVSVVSAQNTNNPKVQTKGTPSIPANKIHSQKSQKVVMPVAGCLAAMNKVDTARKILHAKFSTIYMGSTKSGIRLKRRVSTVILSEKELNHLYFMLTKASMECQPQKKK
ncbi:MAG: hypothetical protein H6728_01455 [Myxococcales bacterium]|nr:hypothetical protein [Myxococcales bacterium]